MTRSETIAYNAGVRAALNHARRIADALEERTRRPIAEGFAIEALRAFAEEGRALFIQDGTAEKGEPK